MKKVTVETFEEEVLKSEIPVLVDFNADWCGPCKMLKPTLEAMAQEAQDYKIVSVNIDDESDLAEEYGVFSIPCLVVFKDGAEADRSVGLQPRESLERLVREA